MPCALQECVSVCEQDLCEQDLWHRTWTGSCFEFVHCLWCWHALQEASAKPDKKKDKSEKKEKKEKRKAEENGASDESKKKKKKKKDKAEGE